jgi:hypothetical protein
MWWKMREWFETDVAVDPHPDLKDDLIGPEYGIKDSGKIYLESKETMRQRGLASPDLADALALTFAAPIRAGAGRGIITPKPYDPNDWLKRA